MINLFQPDLNKKSFKFLKKIFNSKKVHRSKYCNLFFQSFSQFQNLDKDKIIFASSCSDLIFNVMYTFRNIIKKKYVIVPSNSFPAVPLAVLRAGLNLKIIDIEKNTGNISLNSLKKINKSEIGCIFLTHYGGIPVNIENIKKIVSKKVLIFEDCAGALGSFYNDGSAIGSKGDFSCWSFDPMKMITCGEGGAAFIKNKKMYNIFAENLYLGYSQNKQSGFNLSKQNNRWWTYQLKGFGTRSIFTEINAAIGLPQITKIKTILKKRQRLRNHYENNLKKQTKIIIMNNINGKNYSNYFLTIYAKNRDKLAKFLLKHGVYTSLRYYPLNNIKIFKKFFLKNDFYNSNYFTNNALNLPIHNNLNITEINKICKLIDKFYK